MVSVATAASAGPSPDSAPRTASPPPSERTTGPASSREGATSRIVSEPLDEGDEIEASVTIGGFVQADYLHAQDSEDQLSDGAGTPLNRDRFVVRRGRLIVAGQSERSPGELGLEYVVEGDFSTTFGSQAGFRQVEGALVWSVPDSLRGAFPLTVRLGAGVFAAPFGYEVYGQRDPERLFTERSLMGQAFFPGQVDVGARASAWFDWSRYESTLLRLDVAIQNGEPLDSAAFVGQDPNAAKDVLGRVQVSTQLAPSLRGEFGVSAMHGSGFHAGTNPTKETLVWRDLNEDGVAQLGEIQAIAAGSGTASENFERWGLAAEARAFLTLNGVGELALFGEVALASNLDRGVRPSDPVFLGRDQRQLGFYGAVTQSVGSHLLLGFRFDYYQPAFDTTDLQGGRLVRSQEDFKTYTGTVGLRLPLAHHEGRLIGEYAVIDDHLGRDETGVPADLRNDLFTVRAQVVF